MSTPPRSACANPDGNARKRRVAISRFIVAALAAAVTAPLLADDATPSYKTDPSALYSQAEKSKLTTCLNPIGKISDFLFRNSNNTLRQHETWSVWNSKDPGGRLFTAQVVTPFSDGSSLTVVTAAPVGDGCDVTYTTTFYSAKNCSVVRESTYAKERFVGHLNDDTLVLESDSKSVNTLLLPQGESREGCLLVRTETIFGMK